MSQPMENPEISEPLWVPSAEEAHPDSPMWDGTDGAHPAWWRGCDHGVQMTVDLLTRALDEEESAGVCGYAPLQTLRKRLYALKRAQPKPMETQPE